MAVIDASGNTTLLVDPTSGHLPRATSTTRTATFSLPPDLTGKPVCSDLRQHKQTIPIVAAMANGDPEALRSALDASRESESAARAAADLIEQAGGREITEQIANDELAACLTSLKLAEPAPAAAVELEAIAHFAVGRDR